MAQTLDYFLPNVATADTHKRIQAHSELVPYLQDVHSSLYCEEMDKLIDALASWISSSNYKVCDFNLVLSIVQQKFVTQQNSVFKIIILSLEFSLVITN